LNMRRGLNEATPYLTNLLKNTQYIYKNVKYQDRDGYVNTCGSHVVHRLYRLKNDNVNLQTYQYYMKYIKGRVWRQLRHNRGRVRQQVVLSCCWTLLSCTCPTFTVWLNSCLAFFYVVCEYCVVLECTD
ncbi:MAG: hypothetical protein ACKPKO_62980, partial [Candidatus Fonsibacter sp.]